MALPVRLVNALVPVTVVCGHYGVGKTNFAINLALDLASCGKRVTLIDLDVVNPYFRASEQRAVLERAGVSLVAPVFAERGSSLDAPSLSASIAPAIEDAWSDDSGTTMVIIDAGGDDVGATALGRFATVVKQGSYAMLYVVNKLRSQTQDVDSALAIMREIELASHLSVTAFVDNTHLKTETTARVLESSKEFCASFADKAHLPLVAKTLPCLSAGLATLDASKATEFALPAEFFKGIDNNDIFYPIKVLVKNPWE